MGPEISESRAIILFRDVDSFQPVGSCPSMRVAETSMLLMETGNVTGSCPVRLFPDTEMVRSIEDGLMKLRPPTSEFLEIST